MFMQNGVYTASWYLQLQFTINQNELMEVFVFSETTAEFVSPELSAWFISVRTRLNPAYHLLTIVSNWAEFK